jgi:hypothetical protein
MIEEYIAAAIFIYGIGAIITIMAAEDLTAFNRRVFLWPAYWAYLAVSAAVFVWREAKR